MENMENQETVQNAQDVQSAPEVTVKRISEMPLDPEPGVNYVSDEEYERLSSQPEPAEGQQPDTTPEPAPAEPQSPLIDEAKVLEWLSEKTQGKVKSLEDLSKAPDAPTPVLQFANPESERLFGLLQEGKTKEVIEFYQLQNFLDEVPQMPDVDAVTAMLRFKDPQADDRDIQHDLQILVGKMPQKDQYDDDDQQTYEEDLRLWKRKVRMEAENAKKYLLDFKKDIKLPEIPQKQNTGYSDEDLANDEREFTDGIKTAVKSQISSLGAIKVPVVDKDQGIDYVHEITISEQDKASLEGAFTDFLTDFETRYNQGGKYDGAKLARDRFVADNFDKLIASAVKAAYAKGRLSVVQNAANSDFRQETANVDDTRNAYVKSGESFIRG